MKILIMGNASSRFSLDFINNVLLDESNDIYISVISPLNDGFKKFYKENNVKLINFNKKSGVLKLMPDKVAALFSYIKILKGLNKENPLDIIHMHYVDFSKFTNLKAKIFKKYSKKFVLTFWGSDILAINSDIAKKKKPYIDKADAIILTMKSMRMKFQNYYGNVYDYKIYQCNFGNPMIDRAMERSLDFGNKYNLPKDKFIIAIGYNGARRQQHTRVLEEISKLEDSIKDKLFLVLQMTYMVSEDNYVDELKEELFEMGIEHMVLTDFMWEDEILEFKANVNLFIHAQITDASSASLIEYLYLGKDVLNPSWIRYYEWEKLGIEYVEYDKFSDLGFLIEKSLNGEFKIDHKKNKRLIEEKFAWENRKDEWKKVYVDLLS